MASRLSLLSDNDISKIAAFDISNTLDLHDPRFGSAGSLSFDCPTCLMREDQCIGHHASLSFDCQIFHPLVYKDAERIINSTCIACASTLTSINKIRKTIVCTECKFPNHTDYTIRNESTKKPKKNLPLAHVAFRKDNESQECYLYLSPKDVAHILPAGYVVSKILVPPIHLRTPEDVEWSSQIQKLYEKLIQVVRNRARYGYSEYMTSISNAYVKIVGSVRNEGILGFLSGKDGIFRKIMLGKRVELSARAVISPDPLVMLDEVLVPKVIADVIRIPVDVTDYNISQLRAMAAEGGLWWRQYEMCIALPRHVLRGLKFSRKIQNGDLVLLNRQPSLSRESIMCFRVRIRTDDYNTFGINPQVVSPFNADFDGDEMNIFFLSGTAELLELCHISNHIKVDGKVAVIPVQDVVTGCYIMSLHDVPVRKTVWDDCMTHVGFQPTVPEPARGPDAPQARWSELFDSEPPQQRPRWREICDPALGADVSHPHAAHEIYKPAREAHPNFSDPMTTHGILRACLPTFEVKDAPITKQYITDIIDNIGGQQALDLLYKLQNVVERWMSAEGVTVPLASVVAKNVEVNNREADAFREMCYAIVEKELGNTQLLHIIKSGAKGSIAHAMHMAVALGQQYIGGYPGIFCTSSYSHGLTPDEFFGHQMAAREGVVSTGVNTSLTGYLNRRVCKIVADIRIQYNDTVGDKYCISSFSTSNK